jgi:hypothetical protein
MKTIPRHLLIIASIALTILQSCKSNKTVAINPVPDSTIYSFIKEVMKGKENQGFSSREVLLTHEPLRGKNDSVDSTDIAKLSKILTKDDLPFLNEQIKVIHNFSLNPNYFPGWKIISGDSVGLLFNQSNGNFWQNFKSKYGRMGFYTVTMPLFSKDRNIAIIKINDHCGLCGGGGTYVYKKVNSKWILIDRFDEWDS